VKKKTIHAPVFTDPTAILSHLVGLKDVTILSFCRRGPVGEITIEQCLKDRSCPRCHQRARVKDRPVVSYVDLPFGGVPMTIRWKKHRLLCVNAACHMRSFTRGDHRIAAAGCFLTTRAAKWVVTQMGTGRAISHVARELGCSWDAVNAACVKYGEALMAADTKRLRDTNAIGLDETLFVRRGNYRRKSWVTTVCDVANHQLIDLVPTREFAEVAQWLRAQPHHVKDRLDYGCLDMSKTYEAVFKVVTPKAKRVVDRFHVMRHATLCVDETRRRVQRQRLGHRGYRDDPLYKARKLLVMGVTRSDPGLQERLTGLLALGDPEGEVAFAFAVKEAVARFYEIDNYDDAQSFLLEVLERASARSAPYEVRRFARTLKNWFDSIMNWHLARVSNGPTEGMNNLIKRVKRVAFGFTNFRNYRIRALLYVGKPNFRLLNSIVVT
jgi:transposase